MRNWAKRIVPLSLAIMMGINTMAQASKIGVIYNGDEMVLDQEPKLVSQSVLLPLRAISEHMGYMVEWDKGTGKIEIKGSSHKVILYIGQKKAIIDGKETELIVAPQMINGVTYVPLRFIGEAMDMGVKWNSAQSKVELEGKYSIDEKNGKLMIRINNQKQVLADVSISKDKMASKPNIGVQTTSAGSEIIEVSQDIQGAVTSTISSTFYVKNGKVIDKISEGASTFKSSGIEVMNDKAVVSDSKSIRIYDDITGTCIKTLNYGGFYASIIADQYLVGICERTTQVVDLVNGKKTKISDAITNEKDRAFVCPTFSTDFISVVWTTEDTIVFKYYSQTEDKEKIITYKVGQGIVG